MPACHPHTPAAAPPFPGGDRERRAKLHPPVPVRSAKVPIVAHSAKPDFYVPQLDALRFFAFLLVFARHSFPDSPITYVARGLDPFFAELVARLVQACGFGVDLFFLLSSYLITSLLVREWTARGRIDIPRFLARRSLRIWPLYFTFVAVAGFVLPRYFGFIPPVEPDHVIGLWTFLHNWAIAIHGNSSANPTIVLWSVSIEEQFYLCWPLAVATLGVRRVTRLALGLIAISILSRATLPLLFSSSHIDCVTTTRLDPIALGAIIAVRQEALGRIPSLVWLTGAALGFLLTLWVLPLGHGISIPAAALTCGCVVLWFLTLRPRLLRAPVLLYLGKISYGLYVFHQLAIFCGPQIVMHQPGFRILSSFVLTVLLAMLSYRYLESPFLRLKDRFAVIRTRPV